ncbi:MAG: ABC transporter ATP-binding protein, partial [Mailhella sp.]|nr:ABC transporter ATP-binding protein [Mailhella sp.]
DLVTGIIALEGDGKVRCYAGGYSDWLHQRRPAAGEAPASSKASWKDRSSVKRRLTFKEKRELEELLAERDALPSRFEAMEREQADLEARLGDAGLYARDPDGFGRIMARLPELEKDQLALLERSDALDTRIAELQSLA